MRLFVIYPCVCSRHQTTTMAGEFTGLRVRCVMCGTHHILLPDKAGVRTFGNSLGHYPVADAYEFALRASCVWAKKNWMWLKVNHSPQFICILSGSRSELHRDQIFSDIAVKVIQPCILLMSQYYKTPKSQKIARLIYEAYTFFQGGTACIWNNIFIFY